MTKSNAPTDAPIIKFGEVFIANIVSSSEVEIPVFPMKTESDFQGIPCFIETMIPSLLGDIWQLMMCDEQSDRHGFRYCTAKLVQLIDSYDGETDFFRQFEPSDLPTIRQAHRSITLLGKMEETPETFRLLRRELFETAKQKNLPRAYRHFLATYWLDLLKEAPNVEVTTLLSVLKIAAHTAATVNQKEERWSKVVQAQAVFGDEIEERIFALGNLALGYYGWGNYEMASVYFRKALDLTATSSYANKFLRAKYADCLSRLDKFEEAYKLISDIAPTYFSELAANTGKTEDWFLAE